MMKHGDRLGEVALRPYVAAFWALLVLSAAAVGIGVFVLSRQWQAVGAGDVSRLPGAAWEAAWGAVALAADVLAIVLSFLLHRWGWLVLAILLPVSVVVFALYMLLQLRAERGWRVQHESFEAAMTRALAEEAASRPEP
jgi:hypothetical protein